MDFILPPSGGKDQIKTTRVVWRSSHLPELVKEAFVLWESGPEFFWKTYKENSKNIDAVLLTAIESF